MVDPGPAVLALRRLRGLRHGPGRLPGRGGGDNWLGVAGFVTGACLIAVVAALTARETKGRTLGEIDDLHTTRTEAVELDRLQGAATTADR